MNQAAITFPDIDRYRRQWIAVLDVINEIIARVSMKHAAYVLGISDKTLGHALHERERHYPRWDWLPAVAALAQSCDMAQRLGAALVAPLGLAVCEPGISDAEFRRRVEAAWEAAPDHAAPWRKKVLGT